MFCYVTAVPLLTGACAWAQSGAYTNQFRVSLPAPTAPNPFSPSTSDQSQSQSLNSAPRHFSKPHFSKSGRSRRIFVRNRIISSPEHGIRQSAPLNLYTPWVPEPTAYPLDPYRYATPLTDLFSGKLNRLLHQSLPFQFCPSAGSPVFHGPRY